MMTLRALPRRIQRHVKFRLPNESMRRELFALHLPNPERVQADDAVLAALSPGLSGGDILNICLTAIHAGSVHEDTAKWRVTQEMLEREIAKARRAKAEHSGQAGKPGEPDPHLQPASITTLSCANTRNPRQQ